MFAVACAGCHTLRGDEARTPGGPVAVADLSVQDLQSFVRAMPVRLSSQDIAAVAAYVRAADPLSGGG